MNSSPERQIRKFNPGTFQSDEEVIAQFVVRNRELGVVLEVLRGNIDSPSCQHILVVAPRGRGKSMLLARVAAELRADAALSETLLPVRFMEESQEVFNLADFWLETLFHLARECAASHPELTRELRATHADLSGRWRERMLADHARAAVLDAADRLGRKLVLMVENLQSLTGDVEEGFGWKLRGELQMEPRIMLLATATSRFDRLDDVNEPYFELFRILNLEPLATDDCRRLWEQVSGDQVSTREMRPLEILTGGSPRLLVIVAEFARHRSLRQLMEELVTLVDEHTEYFRGHLEALAKTERRVYLAVIDLWQPSAAGEIAARSRLDVRTVSTMLGRLADRGAVIAEGTGRKRRYAAAERLYSIYYKLRRERDEAAVVQNLIRFMAAIYSKAELAGITSGLRLEMAESTAIHVQEEPGDYAAAIAPYDEAIARFGDSDAPEMQARVAWALSCKGLVQTAIGRADELACMRGAGPKTCRLDRRRENLVGVAVEVAAGGGATDARKTSGSHGSLPLRLCRICTRECNDDEGDSGCDHTPLDCRRCFRARPCRHPVQRRDKIRCVDAAHYCSAPAHGRGGTRTNRDAGSRGGYPQTNREDHGNECAGGPSFPHREGGRVGLRVPAGTTIATKSRMGGI